MVYHFIIIIYLSVFRANSETADCISRLVNENLQIITCRGYPAGTQYQNDVVSTSMRRDHVASTLIRRHFNVVCLLGNVVGSLIQFCICYRSMSGVPNRMLWLCAVWSGFSHSLRGLLLLSRRRAGCAGCKQSSQGVSAVGASGSFGGSKNSAGCDLLI